MDRKLQDLWEQYDNEVRRGYVDRAATRDKIEARISERELTARGVDPYPARRRSITQDGGEK